MNENQKTPQPITLRSFLFEMMENQRIYVYYAEGNETFVPIIFNKFVEDAVIELKDRPELDYRVTLFGVGNHGKNFGGVCIDIVIRKGE